MKKIIFSLFALALLASCDNSGYTIDGTVKDVADGEKVILYKDKDKKVAVDSVQIAAGKFTLSGKVEASDVYYLGFPERKRPVGFALERGKINVEVGDNVTITGTPMNDQLHALSQKTDDLEGAALKNELLSFIKANMANPFGMYAVSNYHYYFDLEEFQEILTIIPENHKGDEIVKRIEDNVAKLSVTAIGTKFVDVKGLTPDGKEMALSDYAGKGKLILVDFWASWCPPCVADMPLLVAAYAKYKDQGFEIVGISLDSDNDAWKNKMEQLSVTWAQVSDLKGWESELSKPYAVSSIPYTMLIDGEGTIIAKRISGKELDAKLAELLKK